MLEQTLGSVNCEEFIPRMSNRPSVAVKKYKHRDRCRTFEQTGHCRFGDSCRYLHEVTESPNVEEIQHSVAEVNISSNQSDSRQHNEGPVRKSTAVPKPGAPKLCHSFAQTGRCRYGENCRYRHATPRAGGRQNNQYEDDLKRNPNYENESRLLCRIYARTGYCRYENSCRFAHLSPEAMEVRARYQDPEFHGSDTPTNVDPRQKKGGNPDGRIQPVKRSSAARTKCRFFMGGYCKLGDKCKFLHPDIGVVKNLQEERPDDGKAKLQAVVKPQTKGRAPVKPPLGRQMIHNINELKPEEFTQLRETEIQQLKKRYPKRQEIRDGEEMQYKFTFRPTDPDWAYDVKNVDMLVTFPPAYPSDRMQVRLAESDALPGSVRRCINHAVDDWLSARLTKWTKDDKVELTFRPFLKWLDKNLEDIFTEALKQYKRELVAREAGIVFIPATELKAKYAKLQSESDGENSDGEKVNGENQPTNEDEESDEEEEEEGKSTDGPIDPARRGTEVKLNNLQLKENASTLQPTNIALIVQCNRCHNKTEFKSPVGQTSSIGCAKCNQTQIITFRGGMAHEFTNVIGYIDVDGCSVFDLALPESSFITGCMGCNKDMKVEGLIPGQIKDTWCHHCHGKMRIGADNTRLLVLQPSEQIAGRVVAVDNKKIKRVPKDPAIKDGSALPNNGSCKHYKKSFRWLRFPCCGKAYPCDICHDENEDHEMKYANRMICGYCCKEQVYSVEKPCVLCGGAMTKKTGTHWEGGKGCRDKIKMSRNDDKKYASSNKTLSRKSQTKPTSQKTTRLRHT